MRLTYVALLVTKLWAFEKKKKFTWQNLNLKATATQTPCLLRSVSFIKILCKIQHNIRYIRWSDKIILSQSWGAKFKVLSFMALMFASDKPCFFLLSKSDFTFFHGSDDVVVIVLQWQPSILPILLYFSKKAGGNLRPREISRVSGNLLGVGDGFPNTSLVLVEHGYIPNWVLRTGFKGRYLSYIFFRLIACIVHESSQIRFTGLW